MYRTITTSVALLSVCLTASTLPAAVGDWIQFDKIAPNDSANGLEFGASVSLQGSMLFVGAPGDETMSVGFKSGAAYLFDISTGLQEGKYFATDIEPCRDYGYSVSIDGDVAVIGARSSTVGADAAGAAYLIDSPSGNEIAKMIDPVPVDIGYFGTSVDISGSTAIVGTSQFSNDSYGTGAAFLYNAASGGQLHKLTATDGADDDYFGCSVAIDGTTAIVGAYGDDGAGGPFTGAAYLFNTTSGNQFRKLTADIPTWGDSFGSSVAIEGDTVIAGVPGYDGAEDYSGAAYVFDTSGNQLFILTPTDAKEDMRFGNAVAIDGGTVVVGAQREGGLAGAAYIFDATTGEQIIKLTGSDRNGQDYFGNAVAIDGDIIAVGSIHNDEGGQNSGAVYLFGRTTTFNLNGIPQVAVRVGHASQGDTISGYGTSDNPFACPFGSTIIASEGDMTIGNPDSYQGFHSEGALYNNGNNVTLNSKGFASLGKLTQLDGGTLAAVNGVALGTGDNLAGTGIVEAKVAAGFGSTIEATGPLVIGDATAYDGFFSDGTLIINSNTVTINDRNIAVLGSLTQLGGGALTAGNAASADNFSHLLVEQGKNVIGRGTINGHFKNHGDVIGDGTAIDQRIIFGADWRVSGNGTFENTLVLGTFAGGDSPAITNGTNQAFGGTIEIDLGGLVPGNGNDNHDQINDSATLLLFSTPELAILPWNNFVPEVGDEFVIMTWQTGLEGDFGEMTVDQWFTDHGLNFILTYNNPTGAGNLTMTAVPEPSSSLLLCLGAFALLGARRRKRS